MADIARKNMLFKGLDFSRQQGLKNWFVLAPLTNTQSYADCTLTDDTFRWTKMCSQGGFGQNKTCAIAIVELGRGYPDQLGARSSARFPGLFRAANGLKVHVPVTCAQLSHYGPKSLQDRVGVVAGADSNIAALSDWLDISLWDVFNSTEETQRRGDTKLGVVVNIFDRATGERALEFGANNVTFVPAAQLAHDVPPQRIEHPHSQRTQRPVSQEYPGDQGLCPAYARS